MHSDSGGKDAILQNYEFILLKLMYELHHYILHNQKTSRILLIGR